MTIVKFGRDHGWDPARLASDGPFWVADPGLNFILLRADRDFLVLAETLGCLEARREIEAWIERAERGLATLWNESVGAWAAKDLRTGECSDAITSASALAFYAGIGDPAQGQRMLEGIADILAAATYALPSWDPRHPAFEPRRYWCGPVWAVVNFLAARGLSEAGEGEIAQRLKSDTRGLIEGAGFYEYFDPLSGQGLGGGDFSWTAAMWLAWASRG